MIRPKSKKLDKLKNSYKLALQREKKNLEKQLNSLSKILVETSVKNENFFNDFSKLLEQDGCQKLKEQYKKIIGVYK